MEVQWSSNNSESQITETKPFNLVHKYLAEGLVNNSLAMEVAKLNEKKNSNCRCRPHQVIEGK